MEIAGDTGGGGFFWSLGLYRGFAGSNVRIRASLMLLFEFESLSLSFSFELNVVIVTLFFLRSWDFFVVPLQSSGGLGQLNDHWYL